MTRESVMTALLALLTGDGTFLTTGRRVLPWNKVASQPALFLRHVGETVPDGDTLLRGYNFSFETQQGDSKVDDFVDALQANQDAFLPPPTIIMTVFKQYREPSAGATTLVYSGVSMKVDSEDAEGKAYVTYKFSGFAKYREQLKG